ncbi:MAG TPA: hypothetical protein VK066_20885 [Chloroflexota bacterium]|nr:hypothetical protein [Chloroflexota bacterium]
MISLGRLVPAAALALVLSGAAQQWPAAAQSDNSASTRTLRWDVSDARRAVQAAAAYIVCHEQRHRPTLVAIRPLLMPVPPADSAIDANSRPCRALVVFAGDFTLDGLGPDISGRSPYVGIFVDRQYGASGFAAAPILAQLPGDADFSLTPLPDDVPLPPCVVTR